MKKPPYKTVPLAYCIERLLIISEPFVATARDQSKGFHMRRGAQGVVDVLLSSADHLRELDEIQQATLDEIERMYSPPDDLPPAA